jgi:hypothetical protein
MAPTDNKTRTEKKFGKQIKHRLNTLRRDSVYIHRIIMKFTTVHKCAPQGEGQPFYIGKRMFKKRPYED